MAEQRVESVERALVILETFTEIDHRLSLAELAHRTGLYKSTILRLANSLVRYGYLVRDTDGTFRPGPSLWRLGGIYRATFNLGDHVRPILRTLVEETGESASFYVRDGDFRLCLYRLNAPRAIRHHLDEGARLPLASGAAGHVLRASSDPDWTGAASIFADGHAISLGERDPEVAAVAVPVLDRIGSLRGALSVSGLISRFDLAARSHALTQLRHAAEKLRSVLPVG